jgi:glutamate-ammonia-ligase adenylyltransferase
MLDPALVLKLAHTINPARARELDAQPGSSLARALGVLLGAAFPPLTPVMDWQREALIAVAQRELGTHTSRRAMLQAFTRHVDITADDFAQQLRRHAWREKARIALREVLPRQLGGPDVDETARELSHLADAALELSLREAEHAARVRFGAPLRSDGAPSTFVVFGMGKLGGQELNAGSDIDIIFVYDTDEGESQVSLHEHWSFVARRLVHSIDAQTETGAVFRVDLRLRPEGGKGPLVNSIAAMDNYYETWGRLWERAAWLRGRPVAGNLELGAQFQRELLVPFVYRREVDPTVAAALAELIARGRIEQGAGAQQDLKIGIGGIREAEFFVQALQLIWGGREPSLRAGNTLGALARLNSRGLVKAREAEDIEHGYLLLRRVEHRVQWSSGVQTHRLPTDPEAIECLARSLWYPSAKAFQDDLTQARTKVNALFRSLIGSDKPGVSPYTAWIASFDRVESMDTGAEAAPNITELDEHLRALARRPDGLLGELTRERFPELVDALLLSITESSNPEQAARYLRGYFGKLLSASALIRPLSTDPTALVRFVNILAASAFVGDALIANPDLADIILFGAGQLAEVNPREIVDYEIALCQRNLSADADHYEIRDQFMGALRRAKGKVMVDVAAADLAGLLTPRDVTRLLSELADEILDRAVRFELGVQVHGLAVIAVGKLGGHDIGYGSDLDILFIYDPEAAPLGTFASDYFTRVAQRVIRVISDAHWAGTGYELDTRLRPSGSKGLLVTSLESFARYHRVPFGKATDSVVPQVLSSGEPWERQALLRARFAAGDAKLGHALIEIAAHAAYEQGAPPVREMHRLRIRMERELAREGNGRYDLKVGRGGLLDIEFVCQWLQMRHGLDTRVRGADTLLALASLYVADYLPFAAFVVLRDGYEFLRTLDQRIRVGKGRGGSQIDVEDPGLEYVARRMGIRTMPDVSAAELLITRYRAVTEAVRSTYLELLEVSENDDV